MGEFHDGQEVEVSIGMFGARQWRKAKIINFLPVTDRYDVVFLDGTRGLFQVTDIREAQR